MWQRSRIVERGDLLGFLSRLREEFSFIRGNYLILVLSWILMDFAGEMPGTYYPLYVLELGGTESIIGLIGFASFIALALVQFPGGYLADRYGRKWLVSTMTFGVALSYTLYALAPSWHLILIGAILTNVCLIYQPALMALIADSLPSKRRGVGYSIIMLISSVATTPAPIFAGLLCARYGLIYGMRISYAIVVAFYLIAAILRLKLRETIKKPEKVKLRELLGFYPRALRESVDVWSRVPRAMLFLFIAQLSMAFSLAMVQPYFVIYVVRDLHVSKFDWALLLTFLSIVMMVSALPSGKFIDKMGRKIPLLVSYVLIIPAVWLFVYGDIPKLFISLLMVGLTIILSHSAYSSLRADLVPREQRGKIMGFSNFVNNILTSIGQLTGGILYERVSHQLPFLLLPVFVVPSILITLFLVHEPKRREE